MSLQYFFAALLSQVIMIFAYPTIASEINISDLDGFNRVSVVLPLLTNTVLFGLQAAALKYKSNTLAELNFSIYLLLIGFFVLSLPGLYLFVEFENIGVGFIPLLLSNAVGLLTSIYYLKNDRPTQNKLYLIYFNAITLLVIITLGHYQQVDLETYLIVAFTVSIISIVISYPYHYRVDWVLSKRTIFQPMKIGLPVGLYLVLGAALEFVLRDKALDSMEPTAFVYFNSYLLLIVNVGMITNSINNAVLPSRLRGELSGKYSYYIIIIGLIAFILLHSIVNILPDILDYEFFEKLKITQSENQGLILYGLFSIVLWQIINNETLKHDITSLLMISTAGAIVAILITSRYTDIAVDELFSLSSQFQFFIAISIMVYCGIANSKMLFLIGCILAMLSIFLNAVIAVKLTFIFIILSLFRGPFKNAKI